MSCLTWFLAVLLKDRLARGTTLPAVAQRWPRLVLEEREGSTGSTGSTRSTSQGQEISRGHQEVPLWSFWSFWSLWSLWSLWLLNKEATWNILAHLGTKTGNLSVVLEPNWRHSWHTVTQWHPGFLRISSEISRARLALSAILGISAALFRSRQRANGQAFVSFQHCSARAVL